MPLNKKIPALRTAQFIWFIIVPGESPVVGGENITHKGRRWS